MEESGILLINKPLNMTSQSLLTKLKKILHVKKIGHAGTLDPMAMGLLVVLVNQATKLSDYLLNHDKTYECEILIGASTDTEDLEGKILETKEVSFLEEDQVHQVLSSCIGKQMQAPPMYSSVHYEGKRLYEIAREGKVVKREEREIEIFSLEQTSPIHIENNCATFKFRTTVSKGTYIRTLCVEIGKRLGYPALMKQLVRIRSGHFSLENAYSLEDVSIGNYQLIPMVQALDNLYSYEVNETQKKEILNGKKIELPYLKQVPCLKQEVVLTYQGSLLAIYEQDHQNLYKAKRVWS